MVECAKKCTSCGVLKSLSDFAKQSGRKDGRKSNCKECCRAKYKVYFDNNRDSVLAKSREYYANNTEKCNAATKRWGDHNPDRSKARYVRYNRRHETKIREYRRRHRLQNMAADAAKTARRRSAKRDATPSWLTDQHILEILEFYKRAERLTVETGVKYHVDHIVPLRGKLVRGLHVPWNLQVISAADNLRKRNHFED